VGILVTLTTPSYMVPMFTTTLGFIWLGIAAIMMTFGVWVMAKMVAFDF
jgi:tight adherence protein B